MINLLIVDDDTFTRVFLRQIVERNPEIQVIGEAEDGKQAVEMVENLKPDIVTMDVMMPEMDGLEATARIKANNPVPIIMVSELTTSKDSDATLRALERGAVDYLSKSSTHTQFDIPHVTRELANKVLFWGKKTSGVLHTSPTLTKVSPPKPLELILIGVSMGGPQALPKLFQSMGKISTPIVVAQSMPAIFTEAFVKQIQSCTSVPVLTAATGMSLEPSTIYIIPGGMDGSVLKKSGSLVLSVERLAQYNTHPSIQVLFSSAAHVPANSVAVILTGADPYSLQGAEKIKWKGWPILVQEPKTCVTDSAVQAIIQAGLASEVLTLEDMGQRLSEWG